MDARDRGFDLRGWVVPGGALILAALLAVFALWPRTPPAPAPTAVPTESPSPADDHLVTTDEGAVSFRLESGAIVIRLETSSATTELGRAALPFFGSAAPSGTPAPTGAAMFAMVCGTAADPQAGRYVFGYLDGAGAKYAGPKALGQVASDGLFLFAIVPGSPAAAITLKSKRGGGGFPPDVFAQAPKDGTAQPSGCFVLG